MAVYPLKLGLGNGGDDSVTFTIMPVGNANGKIVAIRVQDISRGLWFNWDDPPRSWDSPPSCTTGTNTLYVAFYITNVGNMPDNITLSLIETLSGSVLATKTVNLAPGAGDGIEWTGNMPDGNYDLTCMAVP